MKGQIAWGWQFDQYLNRLRSVDSRVYAESYLAYLRNLRYFPTTPMPVPDPPTNLISKKTAETIRLRLESLMGLK